MVLTYHNMVKQGIHFEGEVRRIDIKESHNNVHIFAVIPAKAGIQFKPRMDARLRNSGMTIKGRIREYYYETVNMSFRTMC